MTRMRELDASSSSSMDELFHARLASIITDAAFCLLLYSSLTMALMSASTAVADGCPYSRFGGRGHTMCKYMPSACPNGVLIKTSKIGCEEKDLILDLHNKLRQRVATGAVPGQPPAKNMKRMVWDEELEALSKRWAEQCQVGHDAVRDVGRFGVGQNVAATWTFSKEPKKVGRDPEWDRLINGWFDEVTTVGFNPYHVESFQFNLPTGHYTQMAWADTYAVGCAYVYYRAKDTGYTKLYVCNYGPRGNVVGTSMYQISHDYGRDSCQNPGELQSSYYRGLCETEGAKYPNHCEAENNIPRNEIAILTPPSLGHYSPGKMTISSSLMTTTTSAAGSGLGNNNNYFSYNYAGNSMNPHAGLSSIYTRPESSVSSLYGKQQQSTAYRPPAQQHQQHYWAYQVVQPPSASSSSPASRPISSSSVTPSTTEQQPSTSDIRARRIPVEIGHQKKQQQEKEGILSLPSARAHRPSYWSDGGHGQQQQQQQQLGLAYDQGGPFRGNYFPAASTSGNSAHQTVNPFLRAYQLLMASTLAMSSSNNVGHGGLRDRHQQQQLRSSVGAPTLRWYQRSYLQR